MSDVIKNRIQSLRIDMQKNKIDAPIIEVSLVTYKKAQVNPLYFVTSIFWNPPYSPEEELNRIEKEIPGVLMFIENSSL